MARARRVYGGACVRVAWAGLLSLHEWRLRVLCRSMWACCVFGVPPPPPCARPLSPQVRESTLARQLVVVRSLHGTLRLALPATPDRRAVVAALTALVRSAARLAAVGGGRPTEAAAGTR